MSVAQKVQYEKRIFRTYGRPCVSPHTYLRSEYVFFDSTAYVCVRLKDVLYTSNV